MSNNTLVGDAVPGQPTRITRTFPLATSRPFSSGDDLAVDFDLANFVSAGGLMITPALVEGNRSGISNINRHEPDDLDGIISNLQTLGGTSSFTLTTPSGLAVNVATTLATNIFRESGLTMGSLTNGLEVEVYGRYNSTTNIFEAISVKIEDSASDPHEVRGIVRTFSSVGPSATLVMDAAATEGFVPTNGTVTVLINSSTRLMSDSGATIPLAEFAPVGRFVEVEGTFASGVLTATKVKYEDEDEPGNDEAEAEGTMQNINATAGTLRLTVIRLFGFTAPGPTIEVVTTPATVYKSEGGQIITKAQFFAAGNGALIEAEGTWTGTALSAKKLELEND